MLCSCVTVLWAYQGQTQHAVEDGTLAKLAAVYRVCLATPQGAAKHDEPHFRRPYAPGLPAL